MIFLKNTHFRVAARGMQVSSLNPISHLWRKTQTCHRFGVRIMKATAREHARAKQFGINWTEAPGEKPRERETHRERDWEEAFSSFLRWNWACPSQWRSALICFLARGRPLADTRSPWPHAAGMDGRGRCKRWARCSQVLVNNLYTTSGALVPFVLLESFHKSFTTCTLIG